MRKKMNEYTEIQECGCCKGGTKILLNGEGNPFTCPYCKGTGKREVKVPHPSHKMTEWRTEILVPCGTPRFYGVRNCDVCGDEEWSHPAGHFLHRLGFPCKKE
jgi:hypothetical protein